MGAKYAGRKSPPKPPRKRGRGNPLTTTPDYETEETEFIMAMDRYKREKRRPFPSYSEILAVLRKLGWKKQLKEE